MDLPYLTAELPGTGGILRNRPEDFRVDEIPLYEPSGEGRHVYFQLWKRGIDTFEAVRRVARALDRHERDFAFAGLKDSRAVTTQWVSTDAVSAEAIEGLAVEKVAVLKVTRHGNRLKLGHLRGNRFCLLVRRTEPGAGERARTILDALVRRGAPNYFGRQRFGIRRNSHLCGEAIVQRDYERFIKLLIGGPSPLERDPYLTTAREIFDQGRLKEAYQAMPIRQRVEKKALHALIRFKDWERAFFAIPKRMRQMFFSAFQSQLFNRILAERVPAIDRLQLGDLAYLHRNRAVFAVLDLAACEPRCQAFEISPSAPIFGSKTTLAAGDPGRAERRVLAEAGLELADFKVGGGLHTRGQRRSMRIPVRDLVFENLTETSFRVEFALPPGCYATCVMREIMKT